MFRVNHLPWTLITAPFNTTRDTVSHVDAWALVRNECVKAIGHVMSLNTDFYPLKKTEEYCGL
jgi:hypothetical protein